MSPARPINMTMTTEDIIQTKARELCEAIAAQPVFRANFQRIEAFMADQTSRGQYEAVVGKGEELHRKQHAAQPIDAAEIAAFEKDREALLANPVAKNFIEAQDEIHEIQHTVQKLINKTLQLGRVPTADDLNEGGSCGHGCGCH
jgi:cell fate (sporulation/competence/biofilm development) regulator YlbF (YheA/YmcA/DUF963 family)